MQTTPAGHGWLHTMHQKLSAHAFNHYSCMRLKLYGHEGVLMFEFPSGIKVNFPDNHPVRPLHHKLEIHVLSTFPSSAGSYDGGKGGSHYWARGVFSGSDNEVSAFPPSLRGVDK